MSLYDHKNPPIHYAKNVGGSLTGNIFRLVYPTLFVFALALVVLFTAKTHLPLILSKVALFSAL